MVNREGSDEHHPQPTHHRLNKVAKSAWDNDSRRRTLARARLRREAGPCHICGLPIDYTLITPDPMSFELDHLKSKDRYPELAFDPRNHKPSHRQCNRAKSNSEYAPIIKRSGALQ
jgi:5-methylcytosine-specific restriction endonuclease McrA